MAHIKRENKMEPLKEISIYALVSPLRDEVFIWKTLKHNLRRTYTNHYNLYDVRTKAMVEEIKSKGQLPKMFLLEDLIAVHKKAYSNCVAWAKYFKDHGYKIIPNKGIEKNSDELYGSQTKIYEEIKDIPMWKICADEYNLFPNYGNKSKQHQSKKSEDGPRISVRVTDEEYDRIKRTAKLNNMTVAAFCRGRILKGNTINIDFHFAMDFYNEMLEDREMLRQILYAIYSRGNYLPKDMENIQKLVDDILKNAKKIDKSFKAQVRKLKQENLVK